MCGGGEEDCWFQLLYCWWFDGSYCEGANLVYFIKGSINTNSTFQTDSVSRTFSSTPLLSSWILRTSRDGFWPFQSVGVWVFTARARGVNRTLLCRSLHRVKSLPATSCVIDSRAPQKGNWTHESSCLRVGSTVTHWSAVTPLRYDPATEVKDQSLNEPGLESKVTYDEYLEMLFQSFSFGDQKTCFRCDPLCSLMISWS